MSKSKQAGTWAETQVVQYLRKFWGPTVERRTLQGVKDRGDIANIPGWVIEVKNERAIDLAGYLKELAYEVGNEIVHQGRSDIKGVVVIRKRGTLNVGEWYAVLPFGVLESIIRENQERP